MKKAGRFGKYGEQKRRERVKLKRQGKLGDNEGIKIRKKGRKKA